MIVAEGAPREQAADDASEEEIAAPLLSPTVFRFERCVVQSGQEALAQVELVERSLRGIEGYPTGLLVESDSAGLEIGQSRDTPSPRMGGCSL